jgi:hypothetical protein
MRTGWRGEQTVWVGILTRETAILFGVLPAYRAQLGLLGQAGNQVVELAVFRAAHEG